MITALDQAGLDFIIKQEGCILHPYHDQVGIPTIGIGMTYYPGGKPVTMDDPAITQQQANDYFMRVSASYAAAVHFDTVPVLNQCQFNALFSFCYNVGIAGFRASTVLRLVNAYVGGQELKDAFLMWDNAGGQPNEDLRERRIQEFILYQS
jgi:lysozyme